MTEISKAIAAPSASAMSNVVSYFIIFVAALIILKIITIVLSAVFELPVLRTLNRTAGLVFGILCALVLSVCNKHGSCSANEGNGTDKADGIRQRSRRKYEFS